ncbi:Ppx/GppA phosphatase family protein [Sphingosinicella sp.]|uniref:Ppx/GppA phosphatase family protein n=1 Tax=Sphingosinicella sp. TaxID=1917971 RepID=UPI0040380F58
MTAPVAIIDIGSNSVRLVVYSGATRIPSVIFNEKVMAGLGTDMARTGALGEGAQDRALAALRRYALLTRQMGVASIRTVATAAVREASNGAAFLAEVRELGLDPETLTGRLEAKLAGKGVISAIPDANGIVGDLGGGSLELADVAGGSVRRCTSLPLGVLRLDALAAGEGDGLARRARKALSGAGFGDAAKGRPFYLVGGSWRALAQLDMALSDHPLPIVHQHAMAVDRPAALVATLTRLDRQGARELGVSTTRLDTLPEANLLLAALVDVLRPARLIVSSFGIREGLLYAALDPQTRARDPLVEAAREAGAGLGRFPQHGALLDAWIAPLFDDVPSCARLRLAACLLSDIAWAAHPDFRAERGVDMALHGNWVAIDAPGRAMLAQALFTAFGGGKTLPYPDIAALCAPDEIPRATRWGLAIRLGQRLSGGVAAGLERSRLERRGDALRLKLRDGALAGEAVERRLRTLATELGLKPELVLP